MSIDNTPRASKPIAKPASDARSRGGVWGQYLGAQELLLPYHIWLTRCWPDPED